MINVEKSEFAAGSVRGFGTVPRLPAVEARAHTRPWQRVHPASPLLSVTRCTGTRTDPMRRPLRLWHFHFVGAGMQIAALYYALETHLPLVVRPPESYKVVNNFLEKPRRSARHKFHVSL